MHPAPSTFVVLLSYVAPLDAVDALLPEHRLWLSEQFASGRFLASGPQVPREGGVVIARAESREELLAVIATDPFHRAGIATYSVVEFRPTAGPLAEVLAAGAVASAT